MNAYNFAKHLKSTNGRCDGNIKKFGFECTKDSCPFWDDDCYPDTVLKTVEIYIEKTEINTLLNLL